MARHASYAVRRDAAFFLEFQKEIAEEYAQLFDSGNGGGGEFEAKWGWYVALYTLAGESFLDMDAVTEKTIGAALTHLAYLQDLAYKRRNDNV